MHKTFVVDFGTGNEFNRTEVTGNKAAIDGALACKTEQKAVFIVSSLGVSIMGLSLPVSTKERDTILKRACKAFSIA